MSKVTKTAKNTTIALDSFASHGRNLRPEDNGNFFVWKSLSVMATNAVDSMGLPLFFGAEYFPTGMTRFIVTKAFFVTTYADGSPTTPAELSLGIGGGNSTNLVAACTIPNATTPSAGAITPCTLTVTAPSATTNQQLNIAVNVASTGTTQIQEVNTYIEGYFVA